MQIHSSNASKSHNQNSKLISRIRTCCAVSTLAQAGQDQQNCHKRSNRNNVRMLTESTRKASTTATTLPTRHPPKTTHKSYLDVPQSSTKLRAQFRPLKTASALTTTSLPKLLLSTAPLLLLLSFSTSLPLLVSGASTKASDAGSTAEYTNEFALHIKECSDEASSAAVADQLAAKYGFVNHGKVRLLASTC